ncbi:MAG: TIGR03621 family F420-dependent LLM class oxidoreductase [Acidimicrobiia bacterium]|nr:TIGR03621 family F420-dependent LLM class oxidoreductase [Acidimicrobiia bacterium]
MNKPFRFAVQAGGAESDADWRDTARRAEALGYSTLYLPDHFIDTVLAPLPALAMAAAVTETLRVGTLVLGNDYKHPAIVAKEAATIDLLSDGRLELGIGAGWMEVDYTALGIPYDPAGTRIDRLEEAVAIIKGCWREGPFSLAGEHYSITEYDATPKPVQQPGPPLLIGGGGRKVLSLAAREADIVGINPNLRAGAITADAVQTSLADHTREKIAWVKEAAGARFEEIELQIRYFLSTITDDRTGLAEMMAPGFGLTADEALESGVALVGTVDHVIEQLEQRREEWGVTNIVVGDDAAEQFAPVVAALDGR